MPEISSLASVSVSESLVSVSVVSRPDISSSVSESHVSVSRPEISSSALASARSRWSRGQKFRLWLWSRSHRSRGQTFRPRPRSRSWRPVISSSASPSVRIKDCYMTFFVCLVGFVCVCVFMETSKMLNEIGRQYVVSPPSQIVA